MPSISVKEVWRGKDSKPCAAANKEAGRTLAQKAEVGAIFTALNGSFFARANKP